MLAMHHHLMLLFLFICIVSYREIRAQNGDMTLVIDGVSDLLNHMVAKTYNDMKNEMSNQVSRAGIGLVRGALSNNIPPDLEYWLAPKEYDFVIKVPSVNKIKSGYCITATDKAERAIFGDKGVGAVRFERVVAFIGYYSKGKTFLVNQLFNAIQKKANGDSWKWTDLIRPRKASSPNAGLRVGDGVTTEGFSGIAVDYVNDISKATTLIIDCAGRNAPGELKKAVNGKNKRVKIEHVINDMRATERLLDDVITMEADDIMYVVDELGNEEQRILINIIDKLRGGNKRLIVIHNFKRLSHNNPGIEGFISSQIKTPFGAELLKQHDLNFIPNAYSKGFWESKWQYEEFEIIVKHVVVFKHEGVNIEPNNAAFAYLAEFIGNPKDGSRENRGPIMNQLANKFNFFLNQFVTVKTIPKDSENVNIQCHSTGICEFESPPCNISNNEKRMITSDKFTGEDKDLAIRPWSLLARAPGDLHGDFTPYHEVKEVTEEGKQHMLVRVDLPGMAEAKTKEDLDASKDRVSVFWQQNEVGIDGDDYHFLYKITGQRVMFKHLNNTKSFGNIDLRLKIKMKYIGGTFESNFTNGELIVKIAAKSLKRE